jgi:hypothetical protein
MLPLHHAADVTQPTDRFERHNLPVTWLLVFSSSGQNKKGLQGDHPGRPVTGMNADPLGRSALLTAIKRAAVADDHGLYLFRGSPQADDAPRRCGQIEWPRHR